MSQFEGLVAQYKTGKPAEKKPRRTVAKPAAAQPVSIVVRTEKEKVGKSKNPEFTQVLTYLKKSTHNAVKAALIFDEKERDLSDLVEELLKVWITKNRNS